jgi:CsoR family transcriptional regulator, copper-sensing transcriptional repressor
LAIDIEFPVPGLCHTITKNPVDINPLTTHKITPFDPHHDGEPHQHSQSSPHVHSEASLRQIVNRLSRIEGHIRGIKTMVGENRPCPEVLVQIAAVRGAIDRVARLILDEHLSECVARAAKEGNIETELEELKAALDRFLP